MTTWEARDLDLERSGTGARAFSCELLLNTDGRLYQHWLHVDGVLLADGRIMLNKETSLRQAAARAGLDAKALAAELAAWVLEQARYSAPALAAAGAE
jgi:hypothetical protein